MDITDADDYDDEDLISELLHKVKNVPENENDHPGDEENQEEELNR